jgi:hypothetical protein
MGIVALGAAPVRCAARLFPAANSDDNIPFAAYFLFGTLTEWGLHEWGSLPCYLLSCWPDALAIGWKHRQNATQSQQFYQIRLQHASKSQQQWKWVEITGVLVRDRIALKRPAGGDLAEISQFSIVTYQRKPGHWRAAITRRAAAGSAVRGDTVLSVVTPDDYASESEAELAAEKIIRKL